jgi:hypothetical protein
MSYTEVELEGFESSLEHWILSDEQDMRETFGDNLVHAVREALVDEQ